jgi:hypothetical protein
MAKADVRSQSQSIAMTGIVRDALVRHFGSLKAAALEMEIDQAQLHRQLESGTLNVARLAKCGDAFAGKFAALLAEHAAAVVNPKVRGFQLLREIDSRVAEIRQLLEHCA